MKKESNRYEKTEEGKGDFQGYSEITDHITETGDDDSEEEKQAQMKCLFQEYRGEHPTERMGEGPCKVVSNATTKKATRNPSEEHPRHQPQLSQKEMSNVTIDLTRAKQERPLSQNYLQVASFPYKLEQEEITDEAYAFEQWEVDKSPTQQTNRLSFSPIEINEPSTTKLIKENRSGVETLISFRRKDESIENSRLNSDCKNDYSPLEGRRAPKIEEKVIDLSTINGSQVYHESQSVIMQEGPLAVNKRIDTVVKEEEPRELKESGETFAKDSHHNNGMFSDKFKESDKDSLENSNLENPGTQPSPQESQGGHKVFSFTNPRPQ
eukprot:CAMPEP_0170553580 /NCGR_PEP_ID=MMETSP0211-20121228/11420_1 /TAXON_ID=311385 /ORGANISM="Pseudokeronopsis sp., Strain OXSARD2" /LENGTH=323 /DNA_ID=CAMNT_0010862021 /DNA_START=85 /DNA_END=1056 /DNA_ORIENTATION=+